MNSKHRKTLAAIFAKQIPRNITFRDIESLLTAIGCITREGAGSRVSFGFRSEEWAAHRPHPGKEAVAYQVKQVRAFLEKVGVKP